MEAEWTERPETFTLTMHLRWKWKKKAISHGAQEHEKMYEQMWQGNNGTQKWEEIPQAIEEEINP